MKYEIYVIVVTYNGSKWIDKCFGSLSNSIIPLKILAIDNASTDRTPDIIRQKYPQVEVIETGENLGFGKANNLGIKKALEAKADYVFLLNQDAWISDNNTIRNLIEAAKKHKDYGVISPIHLNGTGIKLDKSFGNYLYHLGGRKYITEKIIGRENSKIVDVQFVNAAAWLISRKCLTTVGYFDSLFYHYGEDNNYLQRVKYHSFKIGVLDSSFILHDREGATNSYLSNSFYVEKNRLKMNWADVNKDVNSIQKEVFNVFKNKKKLIIKSFLKLNFIKFKQEIDQFNELKKIRDLCFDSYNRNRINR